MRGRDDAHAHPGLPVAGYRPQSRERVDLVNANKAFEETLLCQLDTMQAAGAQEFDQRWLAVARTNLELGFMALNRAIFRPGRVKLPDDLAES